MRPFILGFILIAAGCGVEADGTTDVDTEPSGSGQGNGSSTVAACTRIDVVISVDNSGSMREEKQDLRDLAFPGFVSSLRNIAGGVEDFRIGVLDACNRPTNFHTRGVGGACNFAGGKPWMESTSPALVDEFKCVGDIDSSDMNCSGDNDDEQPVTSATAAVEAASIGVGKPNEGFLRDDALLVVVAITDEDEKPVPAANAQEVYDRLVAVKGDVNKIVFLGIGGASSCGNGVYGGAKHAEKLENVANLFSAHQRGVFWDLCQGSLEQGLTQALSTIDTACQEFPPIL